MIRKTFVMYVNPDCHQIYEQRHNELWQGMKDVLKEHGGHNYSIHLFAEQNLLFGYVEIENEAQWEAVSETAICREWWDYMQDVMATNSDHSPISKPLKEVFYLK
ncbi:L-rhamnose mutarotase [Vibrio porteresiae]|uniref:L-rhamnose mutarotase n=1 Tax=Vibrio porteresiae DSM 19223 TaxID=1123496 RepID=A0ABZ0Q9N6_9VIBR|nr:L-rhamnose mutarotase [Vibrio porteresiae]WPC72286.1 L-rhamnose mutarotase [Vibrio porteresiae DSM 19223]